MKSAVDRLLQKGLDVSAIVSFVDGHCHMACQLAEEYGVGAFSTQAVKNMENKVASRQMLSQLPYIPSFLILYDELSLADVFQKITAGFPFILKNPRSAGSKDVFLISNEDDYKKRIRQIKRKDPDSPVLVEEYLDGPQYVIEVLVYKQNVSIVAVVKQQITYSKRFIVTGYSLQINLAGDFMDSLYQAVASIVESHGLENGACHLEMRLVNNEWKLIEINPRISGAGMNKLIECGLGVNLVKETLKMTQGLQPNTEPQYRRHVFAQYLISTKTGTLQKVTGRNKASRSPGVMAVYVKPRKGALLRPPLSMGHRYAYVIATGESEKAAEENAKQAAAKIEFWLEPLDCKDDDEIPQTGKSCEE